MGERDASTGREEERKRERLLKTGDVRQVDNER